MNQTEYARHIGVSQQRISQLIRDGYLNGALKSFNSRKLIDRVKADILLKENLDQTKRKTPPSATTPGRQNIWDVLHHIIMRHGSDPDSIKVIPPEFGQEGIIIQYPSVDNDPHTLILISSEAIGY